MKKLIKRCSLAECHRSIASFIDCHSREKLKKYKNYTIALSGGRTPVGLYRFLSNEKFSRTIQWDKLQFFWSDERCVPPTDSASNYLTAQENLLSQVPVLESNVFRAPTDEVTCEAAAQQYQKMIIDAFSHQNLSLLETNFYPQFDLILLGMGEDGHTASLFPNHQALNDPNLVAAVESEYANPPVPRLTFTLPLINSADTVIFMVNGNKKIKIVESFIESDCTNCFYPASMVAPQNQLIWYLVE